MLGDARRPLLIGGHTHLQLVRRFEHTLFVNPGSVRQAAVAIPKAVTRTLVASPATALASSALANSTSASCRRLPAK